MNLLQKKRSLAAKKGWRRRKEHEALKSITEVMYELKKENELRLFVNEL